LVPNQSESDKYNLISVWFNMFSKKCFCVYYGVKSFALSGIAHMTNYIQSILKGFIHWENYVSISFQIEWDMIVWTFFLSILTQMKIHWVQNWKKNCPYDHIPFNLIGNGILLFSVYLLAPRSSNAKSINVSLWVDLDRRKYLCICRILNTYMLLCLECICAFIRHITVFLK